MTTLFMKRSIAASLVVLASVGLLIASDAEAKRIGSGGSSGRQSSNASNRTQAPMETKAPTAGQAGTPAAAPAAAGAAAKAPAAAAAQSTRSKWLGPLAGLAAGLGLAALASSLGFGEGFGQIMLVLLMVMAGFFVIRMIMARRAGNASGPQPAYSAPGASNYNAPEPVQSAPAQARTGGSMIGSGIGAGVATNAQAHDMAEVDPSWRIPADMDVEGFLGNAKGQFTRLQAAYDRADLNELHEFTTQEMYKEVAQEIVSRAGKSNRTEILRLDAGLLGVESNAREHVASVRFTGQLREDGAAAESLDEVWNFSKPAVGAGGWVLAGIQQY